MSRDSGAGAYSHGTAFPSPRPQLEGGPASRRGARSELGASPSPARRPSMPLAPAADTGTPAADTGAPAAGRSVLVLTAIARQLCQAVIDGPPKPLDAAYARSPLPDEHQRIQVDGRAGRSRVRQHDRVAAKGHVSDEDDLPASRQLG